MTQTVAIIDYGMGNLHSVASAVAHVAPNMQCQITADANTILSADKVIFPGVGAMGDCMAEIRHLQLHNTLAQVIAQKQPLLGICVGMQALMRRSEESGGVDGLCIVDAEVKRFQGEAFKQQFKVPHMGWNQVNKTRDHALWHNIASGSRFYFVHSYYVALDSDELIGQCHYGLPFAAMIARDNVATVQFHPEKSHQAGLQLIKNFLSWNGQ